MIWRFAPVRDWSRALPACATGLAAGVIAQDDQDLDIHGFDMPQPVVDRQRPVLDLLQSLIDAMNGLHHSVQRLPEAMQRLSKIMQCPPDALQYLPLAVHDL